MEQEQILKIKIEDVPFSKNSLKWLKKIEIKTIGDLVKLSTEDIIKDLTIFDSYYFNAVNYFEIINKVHKMGFLFADEKDPSKRTKQRGIKHITD